MMQSYHIAFNKSILKIGNVIPKTLSLVLSYDAKSGRYFR